MVKETPKSPRAARSDLGAASAGTAPAANAAPGGVTGPAVPPAGPGPVDPAADLATHEAAGPGARPETDTSTLAIEAATLIAETRPQEAAQVIGAAAGSATEAPSLGAGALADVAAAIPTERVVGTAAGLPPGRYSATGAHGAAVEALPDFPLVGGEALRRLWLSGALTGEPNTGAKLSIARPATQEALDDCRAAGFDIEVTSRQLNFRRAGIVHPITPTLRRSEDFSLAELALLRAEPLLVVRYL